MPANAKGSSKVRPSSPSNARVADWAEAYLEVLGKTGQKEKSAEAAGISLRAVQKRRLADPTFAAAEKDVLVVAKDLVESEITRRAIEGVKRIRYRADGSISSEETEYSDTLILRLVERLETGTWRPGQKVEQEVSKFCFNTRADRKRALEAARIAAAAPLG